jgi:peptidoglycan-N-acetylglucosamine deacetylase
LRRRSAGAVVRLARVREHLDRSAAEVALTFDDGPDPEHTPAVLDELARLGIVATFFLIGKRARAHPEIVRRIVADGHAVGSHSDSHPEPWTVSVGRLTRDYRHGRAEVEWAAGCPVPLFRPPKGYVDVRGAAAMVSARVRPWLWTIDPRDWVPDVRPDDIVAGLAALRGGDVVLLHDAIEGALAPSALDRSATSMALRDIAALAAARGLRFTALG